MRILSTIAIVLTVAAAAAAQTGFWYYERHTFDVARGADWRAIPFF
jgi:hypothetical protein